MQAESGAIARLVEEFRRLPGIGPGRGSPGRDRSLAGIPAGHAHFDAVHREQAHFGGGAAEPGRPVEAVVVGHGQGRVAEVGCPLHQVLGM